MRTILSTVLVAVILASCALLPGEGDAAQRYAGHAAIKVNPDTNLQAIIDAAAPGTTILFTPGEYNLARPITLRSDINLVGETGAILRPPPGSNHLNGSGVHDVLITGLDFDGGAKGGGGLLTAAIFLADHCRNVVVRKNSFHDNYDQSDLFVYNSSQIYFQNNTSGPNEYQPVSLHGTEPHVVYDEIYVTDNKLFGFRRMGIESQINVNGFHIDRNNIGPFGGGNDAFAISIVNAGHNDPKMDSSGTIWGNVIHGTPGTGQWGIELGQSRMTVAQNTIDGTDIGMSLSAAPGSVVEDNRISRAKEQFMKDGGYDGSAWIGANSLEDRGRGGWRSPRSRPKPPTRQPSIVTEDGPTLRSKIAN